MSAQHDVPANDADRVVVLLDPGSPVERRRIVALLVACGIDPATIAFVDPAKVEECGDLHDIAVIVPIGSGTTDDPELEEAARDCAQGGGRIVVLLDEAFAFDGLHPIAANYGTQCGWSPEHLGPHLGGGANGPPLSGSGNPLEYTATRPVKC